MNDINKIITKYLGTPYRFHGTTTEEGLDCANLCTLVGKDLGINIPNINHNIHTMETYSSLFKLKDDTSLWKQVEPRANTLCVFKINGLVRHVGYMLNEFEFIHIMENSKVTVDTLYSVQWNRRLVGCYQYVGNKEEI